LALLVVLGSAVITATAEAYPGSNGRLAFVHSGGIYSVKPDAAACCG
jgi:hypothetical protein